MESRPVSCDPNRLRQLLDDRLSQTEQAELAGHIEACETCRRQLEELAAASRLWSEARRLQEHHAPTIDIPSRMLPPPEESFGDDPPELGFLEPPAELGHLGCLGPYQILEVIGRGGMGMVFKARDPSLDRVVAIKVLTPALAASGSARRRFAREAKAAAAVVHEHVVAIHAVDSTANGLPYIVMQYIAGKSLQERLDRDGTPELCEIVRIGMQAAQALAAAHAQGLIHRDIKPANILLENGVERVKITDFGLARAIDDATVTQSGFVAGTPSFMAPEQAHGDAIDYRADLFSLGSVLYALCTGRAPFRRGSTVATLKCVCEESAPPIRDLNAEVPAWLVRIIARLHSKDPAGRIGSAAEVADLLERCLAHLQQPHTVSLPAELAEPSPPVRWRRWAVAAGIALVMIVGLSMTGARGIAQQVADYVATVLRIKTPDGTLVVTASDPGVKFRIDGEEMVITGAGPEEVRLKPGQHHVQAMKDGQPVKDELITIHRGGKEIVNVALEPSAPMTAARMGLPGMALPGMSAVPAPPAPPIPPAIPASRDEVYILGPGRPNSGTGLVRMLIGQTQPVQKDGPALIWSVAFAPDGRHLAIGQQGVDGTASVFRIWDLADHQSVLDELIGSPCRSVAYSPDGSLIAEGRFEGSVTLLDAKTGAFVRSIEGQESGVNQVVFTPDGKSLAVGYWGGKVILWEVESGKNLREFPFPSDVFSLAISPDGATLAVSGKANSILLYDLKSGKKKATLDGHEDMVESLAFSPDGELLASASWDKTIKLWEPASGKLIATLHGHNQPVLCVRFSPDGKTLASSDGARDTTHHDFAPSTIRLWDVAHRAERHAIPAHKNAIFTLGFSPDGKALVSGSMDESVRIWDLDTRKLRETLNLSPPGSADLKQQPTEGVVVSGGEVNITANQAGIVTRRDVQVTREPNTTQKPVTVVEDTEPRRVIVRHEDTLPEAQLQKLKAELAAAQAWLEQVRQHPKPSTDPAVARDRLEVERLKAELAHADSQIKEARQQLRQQVEAEEVARARAEIRTLNDQLEKQPSLDAKIEELKQQGEADRQALRDQLHARSGIETLRDKLIGIAPGAKAAREQAKQAEIDAMKAQVARAQAQLEAAQAQAKGAAEAAVAAKQREVDARRERMSQLGYIARPGGSDSPDSLIIGLTRGSAPDKALALRLKEALPHEGKEVWSVAYSPDGKTLAIGGSKGLLELRNGEKTADKFRNLDTSDPGVSSIAYSPDGKTFATGSWDHFVRIRDAESGKELTSLDGHSEGVIDVVFSTDGKYLASASWDKTVRIWNVQSKELQKAIGPLEQPTTALAFAPVGKDLEPSNSMLVVGTGDWRKDDAGAILLVDVNRGEIIGHLDKPHRDIKDLAISPDGQHLAVGIAASRDPAGDGAVEVWDVFLRTRIRTFPCPSGAFSVAFSPDGKLLAASEWTGQIHLWANLADEPVATINAGQDTIFSLKFSPDGKTLVSGGKDGSVKLWDVTSTPSETPAENKAPAALGR